MATVRDVKDQVEAFRSLVADLMRARSLRDPLAELHPDLTGPQVHAIVHLGLDGALPTTVLSQRVGASVPSTTGLVDRLERLGLVERDKDPSDRRVVLVRLTDAGRDVFATVDKDATEKMTLLFSALDPTDVETLLGVLERMLVVLRAGSQLAAAAGSTGTDDEQDPAA
jgi:DNA-binding MarR family transcriptional regulator